jgi:hypothetical protein
VEFGKVSLAPKALGDPCESILERLQHGRRSLGHTLLPVKRFQPAARTSSKCER